MTFFSKSAGVLSLTSCIMDMHNTAKIYAKKAKAKKSANLVIQSSISSQMTDTLSYKDTQIKNWSGRSHLFFGIRETFANIKGYLAGFVQSGVKYIPNFVLSAVSIFASSKTNSKVANTIANVAGAALGALHVGHFIKVSSGMGQKKDYLE